MLPLLDGFLTIFHAGLILFILFGWLWPQARRTHLYATLLTCASWFLLGMSMGFGYCFLTDWHWDIKRQLGEGGLPNSFVKYLLDRITGYSWNALTVDYLTALFGLSALGLALRLRFERRTAKGKEERRTTKADG